MNERGQANAPRPLSGAAMELLSAHQRANTIPDLTFERGLRRLEDYQRAVAARRTRRLAVTVGAAVALAAAVVLALLGPSLLGRETRPDPQEQAPYQHDGTAPEVPAKKKPANAGTAPTPASTPPSATPYTPTAPEPPPAPSVRPRPPKSSPPRASPPKSSTLAEERRLLQRAWKTLAEGETKEALSSADEHERRFRHGVLANERSAIRVIADCKQGGQDAGLRAAAYLDRTPGALLSSAVREACCDFLPESPTP